MNDQFNMIESAVTRAAYSQYNRLDLDRLKEWHRIAPGLLIGCVKLETVEAAAQRIAELGFTQDVIRTEGGDE